MPAGQLGPEPPHTPRPLPRKFAFDLFWGRQVQLKIGLFCIVSGVVATCLFPPMGFILLVIGTLGSLEKVIASRRRWLALSHGVPIRGKIDRVQCVYGAVYVGDKEYDEYSISFRFQAEGRPVRGMVRSYDPTAARHFLGEPVRIVHVRGKPHLCAMWPPMT